MNKMESTNQKAASFFSPLLFIKFPLRNTLDIFDELLSVNPFRDFHAQPNGTAEQQISLLIVQLIILVQNLREKLKKDEKDRKALKSKFKRVDEKGKKCVMEKGVTLVGDQYDILRQTIE